jgi:hypothetical protein
MGTLSRALAASCLLWNLCVSAQEPTPILPDPKLTPGDVFDVTIQDMCVPGYSKTVRAVPRALRNQAYRNYGIMSPSPGDYQLDHLIPLSSAVRTRSGTFGRNLTIQRPGTRRSKMCSSEDCTISCATGRSIYKPPSTRSQLTGLKRTRSTSPQVRLPRKSGFCSSRLKLLRRARSG